MSGLGEVVTLGRVDSEGFYAVPDGTRRGPTSLPGTARAGLKFSRPCGLGQ